MHDKQLERAALAIMKADGFDFTGDSLFASTSPRARHYLNLARAACQASNARDLLAALEECVKQLEHSQTSISITGPAIRAAKKATAKAKR